MKPEKTNPSATPNDTTEPEITPVQPLISEPNPETPDPVDPESAENPEPPETDPETPEPVDPVKTEKKDTVTAKFTCNYSDYDDLYHVGQVVELPVEKYNKFKERKVVE